MAIGRPPVARPGGALKGFVVRSVPLAVDSPFCREILCKPHHAGGNSKKDASFDSSRPPVVFVTHLDKHFDESDVKRHFEQSAGPIDAITIKRTCKASQHPALRAANIPDVSTLGHITFFNEAAKLKALNPNSTQSLADASAYVPIPKFTTFAANLTAVIRQYQDQEELKTKIDMEMGEYDKQVKIDEGPVADATAKTVGGFTLVTRQGGKALDGTSVRAMPTAAAPEEATGDSGVSQAAADFGAAWKGETQWKRKKRKGRGGVASDYYRFQLREKQRDDLAKVRSQRYDEEEKIDALRESRVFKKIASGLSSQTDPLTII